MLEELLTEEFDLPTKTSVPIVLHRSGSKLATGVHSAPSQPEHGHFPIPILHNRLRGSKCHLRLGPEHATRPSVRTSGRRVQRWLRRAVHRRPPLPAGGTGSSTAILGPPPSDEDPASPG